MFAHATFLLARRVFAPLLQTHFALCNIPDVTFSTFTLWLSCLALKGALVNVKTVTSCFHCKQ